MKVLFIEFFLEMEYGSSFDFNDGVEILRGLLCSFSLKEKFELLFCVFYFYIL